MGSIAIGESKHTWRAALREVIGLLLESFRREGTVENGRFLPFDTYPSTLKRKPRTPAV